jgi:hypothetical protein
VCITHKDIREERLAPLLLGIFAVVLSAFATLESIQTLGAQLCIKGVIVGNCEPLSLLVVDSGSDELVASCLDLFMEEMLNLSLGLCHGLNSADAVDQRIVSGVSVQSNRKLRSEAYFEQAVVTLFVFHQVQVIHSQVSFVVCCCVPLKYTYKISHLDAFVNRFFENILIYFSGVVVKA